MMKNRRLNKCLCGALLTSALGMASVHGAEVTGIVGKNDWLFYRNEIGDPAHAAPTAETIALIGRFNKVLLANGISMAFTMVPLKMRIYAEHLPDSIKLNDYMAGNYERMSKALQAAGVTVIDLSTPFLNSPKRNSDTPLFYRLDSHWNLTGTMLAAETIKAGIDTNTTLKKALDATPEVVFNRSVGKRSLPSKGRNLIAVLPPNSGTFAPEKFTPVSVTRAQAQKDDNGASVRITLVGSSASMDWTGFADGLRYVLQRDILNVSAAGDNGLWLGMESYLRSDSFQVNAPKMLIWEWAESNMRSPPGYRAADAVNSSENTEWLLRASAWVQATCKPSSVTARMMPVGLAANSANLKGRDVVTGPTNDKEFIEISFDKPMEKLDYLVASVATVGSKSIILEASAPNVATRQFTHNVAGDEAVHALKTPLPSHGSGFTKLRIYPGKSQRFSMQGLKICRQPEVLIK